MEGVGDLPSAVLLCAGHLLGPKAMWQLVTCEKGTARTDRAVRFITKGLSYMSNKLTRVRFFALIAFLVVGLLGAAPVGATETDDEVAAAGNGGTATSSANGGAVLLGDVNSGGNTGNTIFLVNGVWCYYDWSTGQFVAIDGGYVVNVTDINVSADGGTAISDASGGDGNIAVVDDGDDDHDHDDEHDY